MLDGGGDPKGSPLPFRPTDGRVGALKFYPICINLIGAKVVVIGAGRVAEPKLRRVLESGARVTVIAPEATAQITAWAKRKKLQWKRRRVKSGDVHHAKFVITATDDARLNAKIARLAMRQKILVNAATGKATGDVTLPAVAQVRGVTIAISTGGKSPKLARRLREQFERILRSSEFKL